jgi:hypothetical protein
MPGLIRGVARTAVVAGTATAVSNRVSRRQSGRWAAQEEQAHAQRSQEQRYEQQPYQSQESMAASGQRAPASGPDLGQLRELAELRDQGVLTEVEFQTQKSRLLNG